MAINLSGNLSSSNVPYFIKAPTASRLWELMSINNRKLKGYVSYSNIQYIEKEDSWYAWYVVDIEAVLKERANGIK